MLELNKLYNIDCMEGMKDFPDNYFELAIVEPPYGIGASENKRHGTQHGKSKAISGLNYVSKNWDDKIPDENYFKELQRISENQIIWGANYFIKYLDNTSCFIVWDKDNGSNGYADSELAWTSFNSAVRNFRYKWHGMIQENMKEKEKRIHPTQKPIQLYKWLLKNYAKPGDKIIDTHVGSASSLIAFIDEGFDFIGFEIDKDYYESATHRINEHKKQGRLFQ